MVNLRWHGHSCFEVAGEDCTIIFDPHDGRSIGLPAPVVSGDVVLITHDHFDHKHYQVVGGNPQVYKWRAGSFETAAGVVTGINSFHDDYHGERRGENCIFRIEVDGIRFAHLGDLGHGLGPEQVEILGAVDVMLTPIGGVFTIDAQQAIEVMEQVQPRVTVPMHYRVGGLSLALQPPDPFLALAEDYVGGRGGEVVRVGAGMDFYPDDLEEAQGPDVWYFST